MTSTVRRAIAFALVGTITLFVAWLVEGGSAVGSALATTLGIHRTLATTVLAVGPFVIIALYALGVDEGPVFELLARPGDRRHGRLFGLAGFSLAAAGMSILVVQFDMPAWVLVGSVFVLGFGNVVSNAIAVRTRDRIHSTAGFVVGGFVFAICGQILAARLVASPISVEFLAEMAFLAASGALLGALVRSVLFERDDPLVMVSIGLLFWLLADLRLQHSTPAWIAGALVVTVVLGYVAYALDTASIPGTLTGIFLGLLTLVLGGYGWFAVLIAFFGIGGLATKFHYVEKRDRGLAESNEGARGSGNVLANSLVALVAVVTWAASRHFTSIDPTLFLYAFVGSLAAAMSDTLSSEIGGLYDEPRLITTMETVDPGTDGAITWQGELVGIVGAFLVAAIAFVAFDQVGLLGSAVLLASGAVGMTVDSVLGATLEGSRLNNQGVNLLSTATAAIVGMGLASVLHVV